MAAILPASIRPGSDNASAPKSRADSLDFNAVAAWMTRFDEYVFFARNVAHGNAVTGFANLSIVRHDQGGNAAPVLQRGLERVSQVKGDRGRCEALLNVATDRIEPTIRRRSPATDRLADAKWHDRR